MIRERAYNGLPGLPVLLLGLAVEVALLWMLVMNIQSESAPEIIFAALLIAVATFMLAGLFMVNPDEGKVLQLFGAYKGTAKVQGLRWANPFFTKKKVSPRVRHFESSRLKVNDIDGNPIEIAAVVVWKVFETAEAIFEVDDYEHYVKVQTEAARLSHLAYATEIAQAMLQRQQAGAIIAASQRIVEGAVGIGARHALQEIDRPAR